MGYVRSEDGWNSLLRHIMEYPDVATLHCGCEIEVPEAVTNSDDIHSIDEWLVDEGHVEIYTSGVSEIMRCSKCGREMEIS